MPERFLRTNCEREPCASASIAYLSPLAPHPDWRCTTNQRATMDRTSSLYKYGHGPSHIVPKKQVNALRRKIPTTQSSVGTPAHTWRRATDVDPVCPRILERSLVYRQRACQHMHRSGTIDLSPHTGARETATEIAGPRRPTQKLHNTCSLNDLVEPVPRRQIASPELQGWGLSPHAMLINPNPTPFFAPPNKRMHASPSLLSFLPLAVDKGGLPQQRDSPRSGGEGGGDKLDALHLGCGVGWKCELWDG